jgi:pimeloyl-ACP methyl ester carboxylesterase
MMQPLPLSKERVHVGQYWVDVYTSTRNPSCKDMILIHGIGVSGRYFLPFAEECTKDYNVHIIDMPGYGATPKPKTPLTLEQMADVAAEYLRSSHIESAIVVGQSMGCQTAVHLALRHPEICTKLMLIAPTVNKAERNLWMQAMRLLQDTFSESLQANAIIFSDYVRMGLRRYLQTTHYMLDDHIEENVKKINSRILVVRGAKDPIVPKVWTEHLVKQSNYISAVEILHAAHVVQFTKPKELLAACGDFLSI